MAPKKPKTPKKPPAKKAPAKKTTTKPSTKATQARSSTKKAPPRQPRRSSTTSAPLRIKAVRQPTHDEIAERAYLLWERSGHQHGRDTEFWSQAENQLINGLPC